MIKIPRSPSVKTFDSKSKGISNPALSIVQISELEKFNVSHKWTRCVLEVWTERFAHLSFI